MTLTDMASAPATQFWRGRGSADWARVLPTYWEAGAQPHRTFLVEALKALPRFESVRELGCCAGTNLRLIREAFPHVMNQGMDVSQDAVIFAQDKLAKDGLVSVICADMLTDAPYWEPQEVDVVISCYSLAYISPEDLPTLMTSIVRSARVGCVFVEPMMGEPGPIHASTGLTEWRHDYVRLLDSILATDPRPINLESAPLPTPVELCDGLVRVTFVQ